MTLRRDPLTFQHALTRIAATLTVAEMARVVRRSERLVHKWMHPMARAYPTIEQALALDTAFAAAGGEGAPLLETYAQQIDNRLGQQVASRIALAGELATAAKECGEAIAHGLAVAQPGSGPREAHRALSETEEAKSAMAVVVRRISSFLSPGAAPGREATGGAP